MQIETAKDLTVYKVAYQVAMEIFEISKAFPLARKIRIDESDSALVAISLPESAGSVGQAALRAAFCEQTD